MPASSDETGGAVPPCHCIECVPPARQSGDRQPGGSGDTLADLPAPYYSEGGITIYHGDCREILPLLQTGLIVTDPPYGVTDHGWDVVVPAAEWMNSGACIAFASEPYATELITSSPLRFRYDLVWVKNTASNHMNAARMPLRDHERVLVFGDPEYSPIMVPRSPGELSRLNTEQRRRYPMKFPGTVLDFAAVNNRDGGRTEHPSQKPVELMRWLVASYASTGLIDPFMGSGTTLRAAKDLGRRAIGIELEERYCEIAATRLGQEVLDFGEAA